MKTITQLSKILNMTRSLAWYHIRMGHIKAKKIGSIWIIPDKEVERLIRLKEIKDEKRNENHI